jgi:anthranilate synthase component 2
VHAAEAGISVAVIKASPARCRMLGVCLGHQSIGAGLRRQGRARQAHHARQDLAGASRRQGVFAGLPNPLRHALPLAGDRAIQPARLPGSHRLDRWDGEIMGVRHRTLAVEGVQFHPESILTEHGHAMLKNFPEGRPPEP